MVVVRPAASSPDDSSPISATPKLATTVPRVRLTEAVAEPSSTGTASAAVPVAPWVGDWVAGWGADWVVACVAVCVDAVAAVSVVVSVAVADAGAVAALPSPSAGALSSTTASMASSIDPTAGVDRLVLSALSAGAMVASRSTGPELMPASVTRWAAAGAQASMTSPMVRPVSLVVPFRCSLFREIFIRDDLVHSDRRCRDLPCRQRDQTGGHKAGNNNQNDTNSIHIRSANWPWWQGVHAPPP